MSASDAKYILLKELPFTLKAYLSCFLVSRCVLVYGMMIKDGGFLVVGLVFLFYFVFIFICFFVLF